MKVKARDDNTAREAAGTPETARDGAENSADDSVDAIEPDAIEPDAIEPSEMEPSELEPSAVELRGGALSDAWPTGISAITLFVEDLDAAREFYRLVFGFDVTHEDDDSVVFNFGNTIVNLLKATAATDLVAPAPVASPDSGARVQLTIPVDDVDAVAAQLIVRGAELLNGPVDRPWGVRTASFKDPAGHIWEIAG